MSLDIERGDVWEVRFSPSEGDEISKIRPAVVLTARGAGRMNLQIVVPITGWQPQFARYFWMIRLLPGRDNGLTKESAADAFQIKSVSESRFQRKLGEIGSAELQEVFNAVVLSIAKT